MTVNIDAFPLCLFVHHGNRLDGNRSGRAEQRYGQRVHKSVAGEMGLRQRIGGSVDHRYQRTRSESIIRYSSENSFI